ncbi:alpha/beta hydrolase [Streptomyces zagrosensis]|uniref:Pimeloyl-ACP methyl ester carboxylesterase n=1 Tax=Streptomyces zagrosensis TaxID=1042984 RepID=A0A7W9QGR7_9ACTN|nr:alpha/beta hydrolase [Streptomyces zagrosensis]MBB5939714.1 pimeloyl-ACP methyl ester carboxylesterase [Streptomyces zagrosensis]
MRIASTVAAGLGLTGLLAGAVPALAAPAPHSPTSHHAPSSPDASYRHQRLNWGPCSAAQDELHTAGAQCAQVSVPLDYAKPSGRTIQIAVSRVKAKNQRERRGVLFSNPGGPGGTGLANTVALRPTLKEVADRYDLIGFDPRFLGESSPITCAPAPPPVPPGPTTSPRQDFDDSVRTSQDTARRCVDHGNNADLLPHASSRNVARDMDAIRAVLGERKLSYYGISYGADLGAVYTQMFSRRADRIVIDSSTDPAASQYELFQRAGVPLEESLDEWATWAARHDGTYRLGTTRAVVRASVQRLLDHAERRPVAVRDDRLNAPLMRLLFRQLIQHQEHDAALASVVRDLVDADAGRLTEPGPELAGLLELLHSPDLADSMVGGALFMCGDGGWPAGGWPKEPATYWKNMQHSRATQPVFGPFANGMIAPCAFWGIEPREAGTAIDNDVPVLMLQARRDNNVPYEGALALHRKLTGSRLVTADIRSHGVYGRGSEGLRPVPCADRAVNDYLRGGALPAKDQSCAQTVKAGQTGKEQ